MFSASPAELALFSVLRAGWGKVNSLGIWRMRGVLLWLRTKCNQPISQISDPRTGAVCKWTGYAVSCLRALWAGTFTSLCRNPNSPCILAWQTEITLLPCATNFSNGLDSALHPNLSKPAIKWRCYMFHFFFLGWKSRFLGSFSSQPAQLYHEGQREECDLRSGQAKDEALKMPSAIPSHRAEKASTALQTPSCF